jgi:DNA modification methylase
MRRWAKEGIKAQTCVTIPPYYGLRDYGTGKWLGGDANCSHKRDSKFSEATITGHKNMAGAVGDGIYKTICPRCGAVREDMQLGLEETPEEYIKAMVEVFSCVKNILADDGTLWLNIGDSYANNGVANTSNVGGFTGERIRQGKKGIMDSRPKSIPVGCKQKDLIGIPWMLAFALRADGWYLRQDIIWHKPNPMPESVQDRCTKAHEYIFLFSKSQKYHYDHEAIKEESISKSEGIRFGGNKYGDNDDPKYATKSGNVSKEYERANKRSVWTVPVKPYAGAHFAVFPSDLIEPCILAGAPVGGVVLDPFMGSGTTAQVAQDLGRKYLGCELNPDYKPLQDKRLAQQSLELI